MAEAADTSYPEPRTKVNSAAGTRTSKLERRKGEVGTVGGGRGKIWPQQQRRQEAVATALAVSTVGAALPVQKCRLLRASGILQVLYSR